LRIDDADTYFLSEPNGKARYVYGRVPELWNAVDGSIRQANTFKLVNRGIRASGPVRMMERIMED